MEKEKIIKTIITVTLFVIAVYLFVKMMIGLHNCDGDAIFIYGFSLFGLVSVITISRITINDLHDIWKKGKK